MNTYNKRPYSFSQINAYAMQHGLLMGIWHIVNSLSFIYSVISGQAFLISLLMFCLTPICIYFLTNKYRKELLPQKTFTLTQGFLHTFLMLFYASLWQALALYIFMGHFDHGQLLDSYLMQIQDPAFIEAMQQTGLDQDLHLALNGVSLEDAIKNLKTIPPSFYALMVINTNLVWAPLFSLLVAFITRRT